MHLIKDQVTATVNEIQKLHVSACTNATEGETAESKAVC